MSPNKVRERADEYYSLLRERFIELYEKHYLITYREFMKWSNDEEKKIFEDAFYEFAVEVVSGTVQEDLDHIFDDLENAVGAVIETMNNAGVAVEQYV